MQRLRSRRHHAPAVRLHITWQDANTLSIDIDTGTQTRVLHFGEASSTTAAPALQGYSVAQWEFALAGFAFGAPPPSDRPRAGQLKIVTTRMKPGYLRKNGVPYGAGAVLTEYVVHLTDEDGTRYLAITSMLEDAQYLCSRGSEHRSSGASPTPAAGIRRRVLHDDDASALRL